MIITLLLDNPNSWIFPYAQDLEKRLQALGHTVTILHVAEAIPMGDICFLLSCEKIVPKEIRLRNKYNLVVHESALPQGKGWSPLTWQILEDKNDIPITLFEAEDKVDAGYIYVEDNMHFEGHELVDELRVVQGTKTIELAIAFVENIQNLHGRAQTGEESFYPKRTAKDSELDVTKSIAEQFNLLRVVDNERYPAFFRYNNNTYIIKIKKKPNQ